MGYDHVESGVPYAFLVTTEFRVPRERPLFENCTSRKFSSPPPAPEKCFRGAQASPPRPAFSSMRPGVGGRRPLDGVSSRAFAQQLESLAMGSEPRLLVDFSGVDFVSGLGAQAEAEHQPALSRAGREATYRREDRPLRNGAWDPPSRSTRSRARTWRTTKARSDVPLNVGRCQLRILENNPYNSMPAADLELAP
jgi:hypothetical protein